MERPDLIDRVRAIMPFDPTNELGAEVLNIFNPEREHVGIGGGLIVGKKPEGGKGFYMDPLNSLTAALVLAENNLPLGMEYSCIFTVGTMPLAEIKRKPRNQTLIVEVHWSPSVALVAAVLRYRCGPIEDVKHGGE